MRHNLSCWLLLVVLVLLLVQKLCSAWEETKVKEDKRLFCHVVKLCVQKWWWLSSKAMVCASNQHLILFRCFVLVGASQLKLPFNQSVLDLHAALFMRPYAFYFYTHHKPINQHFQHLEKQSNQIAVCMTDSEQVLLLPAPCQWALREWLLFISN